MVKILEKEFSNIRASNKKNLKINYIIIIATILKNKKKWAN